MDLIVDFPRAPCTDSASPLAPQEEGPIAPSRRASFAKEAQVKFIENLAFDHKDALWFSRQEIEDIQRRTARMLRTLRAHGLTMEQYAMLNVQETSAFMGLENYLSNAAAIGIRRRRSAVRAAVLREQHRQDEMGILDFDAMSNASKAATQVALKRARIVALLHASDDTQGKSIMHAP